MARLPHFSLPFRFEPTRGGGQVIPVTEQDSAAQLGDCVELILRTVQGERRTLPDFGRPPTLEFILDRELARAQVQQAINDQEPRVRAFLQRGMLDPDDPGMLRLLAMYEAHVEEQP